MASTPVSAVEFNRLMQAFGPFEQRPRLAVAVSGGADSMALCLLAASWAQGLGGSVTALTVDHGLRAAAAAEAAQVGDWLAARGVAHKILCWQGAKPAADLQAAARLARYELLNDWCAQEAVLHLLLAHHQEDQAETLLLRLGRGSGVDGLSAMAPISVTKAGRLLRPLLGISRARLMAGLKAEGQSWIEDPSNEDVRFSRVRWRQLMPKLQAEGLNSERLAATAGRLGLARQVLEQDAANLMARCVTLEDAGFAWLELNLLADAPVELSLRVLAFLCRTIGGAVYPPRLDRLLRLYDHLLGKNPKRPRTFGGCLLLPRDKRLLVCRESRAVAGPQAVRGGEIYHWDGRFRFMLSGQGDGWVGALGKPAWRALRAVPGVRDLPEPVAANLPALFDRHGICAVPHLRYQGGVSCDLVFRSIDFVPLFPLAGISHCLVKRQECIIS